jgi:hypothetical protein
MWRLGYLKPYIIRESLYEYAASYTLMTLCEANL